MYVYHYHAMRQLSRTETQHIDGLLLRKKPVSGEWGDYQEIKKDIGGGSADGLTLCSLTLVNDPAGGQQ